VQVLPDSFVAESSCPTVAMPPSGDSSTVLEMHEEIYCTVQYSMKRIRCNEITLHRKLWAKFSVHHLLEEGDVRVSNFELEIEE